jgi:hypothetical protein
MLLFILLHGLVKMCGVGSDHIYYFNTVYVKENGRKSGTVLYIWYYGVCTEVARANLIFIHIGLYMKFKSNIIDFLKRGLWTVLPVKYKSTLHEMFLCIVKPNI